MCVSTEMPIVEFFSLYLCPMPWHFDALVLMNFKDGCKVHESWIQVLNSWIVINSYPSSIEEHNRSRYVTANCTHFIFPGFSP